MRETEHPQPGSHAERRRGREQAIARWRQRLSDRDAFLESSLEPGERVIARNGSHPLVTDRRILTARQLKVPSSWGNWILDPLAFDQIVGWSRGAQHDGRPILRLAHHPLTRVRRVPARRLLWWTWGNAVGPVVETTTTLAFGGHTNPVFLSICAELDRRNVQKGSSFVIRPAGTRAERMRDSRGSLVRYKREGGIGHLRHRAAMSVSRGELAWPFRALSWILAAGLAWLASPWLVLPAILASELVWIVVMRWSLARPMGPRPHRRGPRDQPVP